MLRLPNPPPAPPLLPRPPPISAPPPPPPPLPPFCKLAYCVAVAFLTFQSFLIWWEIFFFLSSPPFFLSFSLPLSATPPQQWVNRLQMPPRLLLSLKGRFKRSLSSLSLSFHKREEKRFHVSLSLSLSPLPNPRLHRQQKVVEDSHHHLGRKKGGKNNKKCLFSPIFLYYIYRVKRLDLISCRHKNRHL